MAHKDEAGTRSHAPDRYASLATLSGCPYSTVERRQYGPWWLAESWRNLIFSFATDVDANARGKCHRGGRSRPRLLANVVPGGTRHLSSEPPQKQDVYERSRALRVQTMCQACWQT